MQATCPHCDHEADYPDELVTLQVPCRKCDERFQLWAPVMPPPEPSRLQRWWAARKERALNVGPDGPGPVDALTRPLVRSLGLRAILAIALGVELFLAFATLGSGGTPMAVLLGVTVAALVLISLLVFAARCTVRKTQWRAVGWGLGMLGGPLLLLLDGLLEWDLPTIAGIRTFISFTLVCLGSTVLCFVQLARIAWGRHSGPEASGAALYAAAMVVLIPAVLLGTDFYLGLSRGAPLLEALVWAHAWRILIFVAVVAGAALVAFRLRSLERAIREAKQGDGGKTS